MSRRMLARCGLLVCCALPLASCSDDGDAAENQTDASAQPGVPSDARAAADAGRAGDIDAAVDAAVPAVDAARPAALVACLERPGTIPSAPSGELPCALLPPGFSR